MNILDRLAGKKPKPIDWMKYPLRTCYSLHECKLCQGTIRDGQQYFDGGYGRRAHLSCLKTLGLIAEDRGER